MKRFFTATILLATLSGVLLGCKGREAARFLVVSEVTHFEIQGNGKALNFPVFAGTLSTDDIARDVTLAEYYYKKLASVYEFKSFTFVNTKASETLLDREGKLAAPQPVYAYEDSSSRLELWLISFTRTQASYLFRITDKFSGQVRDYTVEVPEGKSASVGILFDRAQNRGHLISISVLSLPITSQLTVEQFAAFLKKKNTPRGGKAPEFFPPGDQRWMDEIFGAKAVKLPIESPQPGSDDSTAVVEFDSPPHPVGGMQGLADLIIYPPSAKKDSVEGRVFVQAFIGKDGTVTKARVIRGVRADLDSAAVHAVCSMRFSPALQAGNPVAVWITIPIQFILRP
jgi:TonB family protein